MTRTKQLKITGFDNRIVLVKTGPEQVEIRGYLCRRRISTDTLLTTNLPDHPADARNHLAYTTFQANPTDPTTWSYRQHLADTVLTGLKQLGLLR